MNTTPLLARVQAALAAANILNALIGAAALATYGITRSTLDHDLLVADPAVLDPSWNSFSRLNKDP